MQNGYADPRHAALLQAQAALQVGSSLASRPPSVVKRLQLCARRTGFSAAGSQRVLVRAANIRTAMHRLACSLGN